jgi:hypothetical protein
MNGLRLLLLLMLLVIVVLYRPLGIWARLQRMYAQRNYVLGVFVMAIVLYLIYGLYSMYLEGYFDWLRAG